MQKPTFPDLVYARINERKLLLDLYLPKRLSGACPLIVWTHGGAFRAGSKADCQEPLKLLSDGYAVASVGYRLSQEAIFPALIRDLRAAVRWLRQNARQYGLNAERFTAWGPSAGGYLAAMLGAAWTYPDWDAPGEYTWCTPANVKSSVQAVVDWFGPTDFNRMNDGPGIMDHFAPDSPESQLIGGPVLEHPERVQAANPITYLDQPYPPFLICHGSSDLTVLPNQSKLLHEALIKKGYQSELMILPGAGHGFQGSQLLQALDAVRTFLKKVL